MSNEEKLNEQLSDVAELFKVMFTKEELEKLEKDFNEFQKRMLEENKAKEEQYNVEWCKGSTNVFGTFSYGSNPYSTTKKDQLVIYVYTLK